MIQQIKR